MADTDRPPLRVLTLEDEGIISMSLEDILRDAGYAVKSAATSKQALSLLDAHSFDVAILDIELLAGNSDRVAQALSSRRIPFIFCTASNSEPAMAFVDVPVLGKPFSDTDLFAALARVMPR